MRIEFEKYKDGLYEILQDENYRCLFLNVIEELHNQGRTKAQIYHLFVDFHSDIQIDPVTKNDEDAYDRLSDFMDGFTAWGKHSRILPNEPDVQ